MKATNSQLGRTNMVRKRKVSSRMCRAGIQVVKILTHLALSRSALCDVVPQARRLDSVSPERGGQRQAEV